MFPNLSITDNNEFSFIQTLAAYAQYVERMTKKMEELLDRRINPPKDEPEEEEEEEKKDGKKDDKKKKEEEK